jgi:hypothetical protein
MPRKPGRVVKGRYVWIRGGTIENLLSKRFGIVDSVSKSQELTDSDLAALVDDVLREYVLGLIPQMATVPAPSPQPPPEPKPAEEPAKRMLDTELREDDFDF